MYNIQRTMYAVQCTAYMYYAHLNVYIMFMIIVYYF